MIQVENLTKKFGSFTAVDNISFSIKHGEVVGFLGPNGAGKSTTMRMITGYYSPTDGNINLGKTNVVKNPTDAKKHIGYLPENSPAYKDMIPIDFLRFIASLRGIKKNDRKNAIDRVINICSLEPVLYQQIDTLSKGFLQRVCLAQAIIHDPPYLILDEPTDGLDPNQKRGIRKLIKDMGKDKTIMISTHILEEINACCSRVIVISKGRIVADGTEEYLKKKSDTYKTVVFKTNHPIKKKVLYKQNSKIKDIVSTKNSDSIQFRLIPKNHDDIASILFDVSNYIRANNISIIEFYVDNGNLSEAFQTITENK
ncbi:MAG TPA: ATP-binding cassette domain-containing protein [Victivallales bacterium]|nr:ATP-binding cassette domain-containing protein [Victivallales bacterium]